MPVYIVTNVKAFTQTDYSQKIKEQQLGKAVQFQPTIKLEHY